MENSSSIHHYKYAMKRPSGTHFFNRQLDFPSEPGVANEILENEAKSFLAAA